MGKQVSFIFPQPPAPLSRELRRKDRVSQINYEPLSEHAGLCNRIAVPVAVLKVTNKPRLVDNVSNLNRQVKLLHSDCLAHHIHMPMCEPLYPNLPMWH